MRSLDAISIGYQVDSGHGAGPSLLVPNGGVGLIRGRGIGASFTTVVATAFTSTFDGSGPITNPTQFNNELDAFSPIGGDIQMVDAADEFVPQLVTNKAIGTVRAGSMDVRGTQIFAVNADGVGNDGVIDLIDVAGDFGTIVRRWAAHYDRPGRQCPLHPCRRGRVPR